MRARKRSAKSESDPPTRSSKRRRSVLSLICWYFLPFLVVCCAGAFVYSTTVLHLNPPVVPVEGGSMRPVLVTGDLVVLEPTKAATLRVGDVIALHVPDSYRKSYGVPANVVHRIVAIKHDATGRVFITKGDANSGRDVFETPASDVIGKLRLTIPWLGYPALFVQSTQGRIFLGAVVVVALLYFIFGLFDERRASSERTLSTMTAVLSETERLERFLAGSLGSPGSSDEGSPGPQLDAQPLGEGPPRPLDSGGPTAGIASRAGVIEPSPTLGQGAGNSDTEHERMLLADVERALVGQRAAGEEVDRSIRAFAEAVRDYATHLQSHTSVIRDLSEVTGLLRAAVSDLDRRLAAEDALASPSPHMPPSSPDKDRITATTAAPDEPPLNVPSDGAVDANGRDDDLEGTSEELFALAPTPPVVERAPIAPPIEAAPVTRDVAIGEPPHIEAPSSEAPSAERSSAEGMTAQPPLTEPVAFADLNVGADGIETVTTAQPAIASEEVPRVAGIIASSWDLERWAAYQEWCASSSGVVDPSAETD